MDWNHDGHLDILSGCYWTADADGGHIQMLAGKGSLDFAAAVELKDTAGKPLLNVQLAGGENNGMDPNQTRTICTHQHAVDYDGDGDLDLVIGCFGPEFFFHENTGTAEEPQFAGTSVQLPVRSTSHHSAPHLVDWDGDGDLDLLSGTAEGGAILSENTGSRKAPEWSAFRQLIPPAAVHEQTTAGGREIEPSPSTRLWATDWNGDGLLDLLVGDSCQIVNPKEGIGADEYENRLKEFNRQVNAHQKIQQPLYEQYSRQMAEGGKADEELQKKMEEASAEFQKIYSSRDEFQESRSTGFVWLYLRKPALQQTLTSGPDGK